MAPRVQKLYNANMGIGVPAQPKRKQGKRSPAPEPEPRPSKVQKRDDTTMIEPLIATGNVAKEVTDDGKNIMLWDGQNNLLYTCAKGKADIKPTDWEQAFDVKKILDSFDWKEMHVMEWGGDMSLTLRALLSVQFSELANLEGQVRQNNVAPHQYKDKRGRNAKPASLSTVEQLKQQKKWAVTQRDYLDNTVAWYDQAIERAKNGENPEVPSWEWVDMAENISCSAKDLANHRALLAVYATDVKEEHVAQHQATKTAARALKALEMRIADMLVELKNSITTADQMDLLPKLYQISNAHYVCTCHGAGNPGAITIDTLPEFVDVDLLRQLPTAIREYRSSKRNLKKNVKTTPATNSSTATPNIKSFLARRHAVAEHQTRQQLGVELDKPTTEDHHTMEIEEREELHHQLANEGNLTAREQVEEPDNGNHKDATVGQYDGSLWQWK